MDAEKLRNLTDAELLHQQRELNDQLFRLKFQLKMGQTESLNKIRGLRKDVARIHTLMREKQLGLSRHAKHHRAETAAAPVAENAAPAKSKPSAKSKAGKPATKARKK
jgi:large subunit ribosomal protein L29